MVNGDFVSLEVGDVCTFNMNIGPFKANTPVIISSVTRADNGHIQAFGIDKFPEAPPYTWQQQKYLDSLKEPS